MLAHIRHMLAPPVFEGDERKTQVARVVNTLALITLACSLLDCLVLPVMVPSSIRSFLPVLLFLPVPIATLILVHRGYIRTASFMLTGGGWLVLVLAAAVTGGVSSPAFSGLIIVVLIAGVLLGPRASLGVAGLSIASGLGLILLNGDGLLAQTSLTYTPWNWWFTLGSYFVVVAALLRLATYSISESLEHARRELADRQRAEEALRTSEERLRTVVANTPVILFALDRHGVFTLSEGKGLVARRAKSGQVVGKSAFDLLQDNPELLNDIRRALAGEEFNAITQIRNWAFDIRYSPLRDQNNELAGVIGIATDITERKQADEARRQSEKRYRLLFENMLDGFAYCKMLFDEQGRPVDFVYLDVNDAFARLTGLQDVVGKRVTEVIPEIKESNPELFEIYGRVASTGRPERFELDLKPLSLWLSISVYSTEKGHFIAVFDDVTERKRAEQQIQLQLQRLSSLHAIDTAITGILDLRVILSIFLEQVTAQLGVDAAAIWLLDPSMQMLELASARGFRSRVVGKAHLRLGESYAGEAAMERRLVQVRGPILSKNGSALSSIWASEGFHSYHGIPLIAKGQVKGVLEILHRTPLRPDQEWLSFLQTLATQGAIAIDSTSLFRDLQQSNIELSLAYDTTLEGWSRALDLRDRETEGHTQRVTLKTLRLARAFGLRDEELAHIRRGALLHDIGKMGIPDNILLKAGPLTEEEWALMRRHPVYAYELISPITFLRPALDIPYCHHERWDGTGYPRGLKGEEIPLAARLFAVVDVWDALCSDRPYRPAWPSEQALQHIRAQAGKHFDPRVVDAFMPMIKEQAQPVAVINLSPV